MVVLLSCPATDTAPIPDSAVAGGTVARHYLWRMNAAPVIDVVIPAYNEEASVAKVVRDLPRASLRRILVCDNASTDATAAEAERAGATVLYESRPGYGSACLCGLEYIEAHPPHPDVVVFLDADYSDHPEELPQLVAPILTDQKDLVIGARVADKREPGAMLPQQLFGNWLATRLIRWLYGHRYTDLGPFRAIRYDALQRLQMRDTNYGWTVEMQVKALQHGLRIGEVPVSYRQREGISKISGTVKGTIMAGYKIIKTILVYARQ